MSLIEQEIIALFKSNSLPQNCSRWAVSKTLNKLGYQISLQKTSRILNGLCQAGILQSQIYISWTAEQDIDKNYEERKFYDYEKPLKRQCYLLV